MMKHELANLPYAYNALEPIFDEQTMQLHHSKHHATYVNNLNAALEKKADLFELSLEDLLKSLASVPAEIQTAVRNNGGGHWNHTFFWESLAPVEKSKASSEAAADILAAIQNTFGGLDAFKEKFKAAALGRFGSGWAWLVADAAGALHVSSSPNQDPPLLEGHTALLGLDVWEHAYYLKYNNRRADYVDAFWNIVDWEVVNNRFLAVKK